MAKAKKIAKTVPVKKTARKASAPRMSAKAPARKVDAHKPSLRKPSTPLSAAVKPAAAVTSSQPAARGDAPVAQRADLPPTTGFTLLVDGHFKGEFDTLNAAKAATAKLKDRFPMLRLEIYDAARKTRVPV
jgi:hypothetical protein